MEQAAHEPLSPDRLREFYQLDAARDGEAVVAAVAALEAHRPGEARRLMNEAWQASPSHSARRALLEVDRNTRFAMRPYHAMERLFARIPGEGAGAMLAFVLLGMFLERIGQGLLQMILSGAAAAVLFYYLAAQSWLPHLWAKLVPGTMRRR